MRFKVKPEDFGVEELARLPLAPEGDYAVYRVEKRDVTTLQVQTAIAAQLKPARQRRHDASPQGQKIGGDPVPVRFVGQARQSWRVADTVPTLSVAAADPYSLPT